MSEIAPELQGRVWNAGRLAAHEVFVQFLNPEARGSAFSWEDLPECAASRAKGTWFNAVSEEEYQGLREELADLAQAAARSEAEDILEESAILSWWRKA